MNAEIATMQQPSTTQIMSVADQMNWAKAVSNAGILPAAYRGKPADVLVAVGFGQSMGLSPAESLYRINVIQGKPTMSAELIAAQVRKAGHKLRIHKDEKAMSVTATIIRCDDPDYPFTATRDQAWAHGMGLDTKDNYRKQPMTMLTWRAITACAREACPEALFGVAYTPDEMYDFQSSRGVRVESVEETTATAAADDATVVEPDGVEASAAQRRQLSSLLHEAGARTKEDAARALTAVCGYTVASTKELDADMLETLLDKSNRSMLMSRLEQALTTQTDKEAQQ